MIDLIIAIIVFLIGLTMFITSIIDIKNSQKADMNNYRFKLKKSLKIARMQVDQDNSDYYDALYKARKLYYNALKKETKDNVVTIVDDEYEYKKALYEKAIEDINEIHLNNSKILKEKIDELEKKIEIFSL